MFVVGPRAAMWGTEAANAGGETMDMKNISLRLGMGMTVIALFATMASTSNAGASGGRRSMRDTVNGHSRDEYRLVFNARQPAVVRVSGDGSSDIDCFVYDSNNNLVDEDTDDTDTCLLTWTPVWTGKFTLRIVNQGAIANEYVVVTN